MDIERSIRSLGVHPILEFEFLDNIMNRILATTLTTILLTGYCLAAQAVERPFLCFTSGQFVGSNANRYVGEGQATHLGQISQVLTLRPSAIPRTFFPRLESLSDFPSARMGGAFFVAADGSTLQGTVLYETYDAVSLIATAELTIVSGSGRFENATGSMNLLLLFTSATLLECDVLLEGTLDYCVGG